MDNIALIVDLVFLAIFLIIIVTNTIRGFVKAFMKMGSSIVSVLVAGAFSGKLGAFFHERFVGAWIDGKIADIVLSALPASDVAPEGVTVTINNLLSAMTGKFSVLLSLAGVNVADLSGTYGSLPATEENITLMSSHIGENISMMLSKGLGFIAIFSACLLLFALITALLNAMTQLPVIKTANRILGLLFGVIYALIIGSVGSLILTKAIEIIYAFDDTIEILHLVEGSKVLQFFSKYNFVSLLIGSIVK